MSPSLISSVFRHPGHCLGSFSFSLCPLSTSLLENPFCLLNISASSFSSLHTLIQRRTLETKVQSLAQFKPQAFKAKSGDHWKSLKWSRTEEAFKVVMFSLCFIALFRHVILLFLQIFCIISGLCDEVMNKSHKLIIDCRHLRSFTLYLKLYTMPFEIPLPSN